jgi:uncharacterized membrane protein YphA (DoxX/SURF4 family)
MRTNPFNDTWLFLIGRTDDHDALGTWKYLFVMLFLALMAASIIIAIRNWREDPTQRTGTHLATWFMRVLIGAMWFEGMLWKLPLVSEENGLYYWMEQMAGRAAFEVHRELVTNVFLPYFNFFNPIIFLAELVFATCLILGFGVRIIAVAAVLFTLHLWLGIYLDRGVDDPDEWPWSYIFLAMVLAFFAIHAAGRSLGLDALLRRHSAGLPAKPGGVARLYRAVS